MNTNVVPSVQHCRACQAAIVFLKTKTGKSIPINADTVRVGDTDFDHTRHKSHFADCPQASQFRKPRRVS